MFELDGRSRHQPTIYLLTRLGSVAAAIIDIKVNVDTITAITINICFMILPVLIGMRLEWYGLYELTQV